MTYPIDILGRPPIMREQDDEEIDRSEDWKQSHLMSAKTGKRNQKQTLTRPTVIKMQRDSRQ